MKVQATRLGYYDLKRRKEGEIFDIKSEKEFSDHNRPTNPKLGPGWMIKVDGGEEILPVKRGPKSKAQQNQDVI